MHAAQQRALHAFSRVLSVENSFLSECKSGLNIQAFHVALLPHKQT